MKAPPQETTQKAHKNKHSKRTRTKTSQEKKQKAHNKKNRKRTRKKTESASKKTAAGLHDWLLSYLIQYELN